MREVQIGPCRLINADCRDALSRLDENSIDTIITDPPYHLTTGKKGGTGAASLNPNSPAGRSRISTGFMGTAWDGGDFAFQPEIWEAALRVAKPGAILMAFGGTRTFHRLACAIEDAGWELRDTIMWVYGTGFPKSLDISKAIDKAAGAEREFVAENPNARPGHDGSRVWIGDKSGKEQSHPPVTAPATDAAKAWSGYGTALKPAWEPIIVAMKPLDGTFAENAIKHGVAGLNIDGGRIALNGDYKCNANGRPSQTGLGDNYNPLTANQPSNVGRFPANLILSYPETEYRLRDDVTPDQLSRLAEWLREST